MISTKASTPTRPTEGRATRPTTSRRAGDLELGETVSLLETDQGRCSVRLALSNAADPFSPEEISNSVLVLQWTRLETGFEVVGYLS